MSKLFNLQLFADEMAVDSQPATDTQVDATQDSSQPTTDNEGAESFDSLIKGKYKAEYSKSVQDAISKRFKNQQDFEARYNETQPILAMVAQKYGINPSENGYDVRAIQDAIANDNSLYEKEAFERGMSVEDLKQMKALERENMAFRQREEAMARQNAGRQQYEKLMADAQTVRQTYPDFDLDMEMQNPDFGRLAAVGIPLKTAYEVVHKNEIMGTAMQYATQKTQEAMSKSIQSGMRRPTENGMSNNAASAPANIDPTKLTKKDFAEQRMRAERGEKIYLR